MTFDALILLLMVTTTLVMVSIHATGAAAFNGFVVGLWASLVWDEFWERRR